MFICANDFVALDTMQVFKELGIRVPEDVWLCGFDDSPESRVTSPTLTTIHIHSQIMGLSAVHLLVSRIKEPTLNFRRIYTETSLIYRSLPKIKKDSYMYIEGRSFMHGILNPEGPVMSFITKITYSAYLNLLWLICCLPIVTAGASTTALFYVTLKVAKKRGGAA